MFRGHQIATLAALMSAPSWIAPAQASIATSDKLPFRALVEPSEHFTASDLTGDYEVQFVPLHSLLEPPRRLDLDRIEADADWAQAEVDSVACADSTALALFGDSRARDAASLPPEERDALTPATAGVRVGLPGPSAAITALAGGLGLLVKLIYELSH